MPSISIESIERTLFFLCSTLATRLPLKHPLSSCTAMADARPFLLVRSEAGYTPLPLKSGGFYTLADFKNPPSKPSIEMINALTVDQMKQMISALRSKATVVLKNSFATKFHEQWDGIMEHGMTASVAFQQGLLSRQKKKTLIFIKVRDGMTSRDFAPMMVNAGSVIQVEDIHNMMDATIPTLTKDMLTTMKKDDLRDLVSCLNRNNVMTSSKKDDLIIYVLNFWGLYNNLKIEGFTDETVTSTLDAKDYITETADDEATSQDDESETDNSEATDANEIILEEKDEKVAGFVNVIYYLDGRRYTMQTIYYQSETFGDFAKRFPASVRDKIGDDFKFKVMQSYVENYDTLSSVLTPEFDTVTIVPMLRGGGLVKKDTLKKKHTVALEEAGFKKCYDLMVQSRSATTPKLKDILNAMNLADLKEYRSQMDHHKANNPKKVSALASFSENYALVDAMIEELTVLKKKIEENVVQSANNECTAQSGEFRMAEFKKALDIAIAVKEATPSSAYPVPDATMNA